MAEFIAFLLLSKLRTADSMQPCNTCRNAQIQIYQDNINELGLMSWLFFIAIVTLKVIIIMSLTFSFNHNKRIVDCMQI